MMTRTSAIQCNTAIENLIDRLCPTFGTKASDAPLFDGDRHAWLVNQYLSPKGNRILTYVAVCDNLAVEFITGQHYSMEYINSLRILVPDGFTFKVAQTYKWDQKTHFSNSELHEKTRRVLAEFIKQNASGVKIDEMELEGVVCKMVYGLFDMDSGYVSGNGRSVLEAYCKYSKTCNDFSRDIYLDEDY